MLSFDVDGVSGALNQNPDSGRLPSFMSAREYGPSVGTPRILDLLDKYAIKASFYIPGYVAETHEELVREIQRHPVRHNLLHADFYAVNMSETQQVSVPLVTVGESVVGTDLVMVQTMDSVEIEALPADIPAHIEVDVSPLEDPESPPITVADLPSIAGVTYITDPDDPVCSLILSRAAVSEEDEEAEAEMVDPDAEPEVIGRGREDEEEEE